MGTTSIKHASRWSVGVLALCTACTADAPQGAQDPFPLTVRQSQNVAQNPALPTNRAINNALDEPLASIDSATGKLFYGPYANQDQDNADHILPDFSHAGYGGGGVALPAYSSIPVLATLAPEDGDDLARIQSALDNAATQPLDCRGIRGAVLLTAGLYEVSDRLIIPADGVVLRGEGQGASGTIIRGTTTVEEADLIEANGSGAGQNPTAADDKRAVTITQDYVPVGATSLTVASTEGYSVGDHIAIHRIPNDEWIGPNGVDMAIYDWTASTYDVSFQRTVTEIDGDRIYFDIPIVDTMEAQFGGGEVYRIDTSGRLSQIGIENLRLETLDYTDVRRRDRAVDAISFDEVEHSWVRDVTVRHFSHGFVLNDGVHFVTLQDVAFIEPDFEVTGGNHYSFHTSGGGMNLFQRCYSDNGRHSFVTGSRTTGPNVFLDCVAEDSQNDSGPHHRWATGTLYDNTKDDLIRVQNRQDAGTGHGWAGAQQMFWNGAYDEMVLQAPPAAMNWAVGNVATIILGDRDPDAPEGLFNSHGTNVLPRSLYLQQLEDRLGAEAVDNIASDAQQAGRIWTQLEAWRGEGTLASGGAFTVGGAADDMITGSDVADTLIGGEGNDHIEGGDGDDLLIGDQSDLAPTTAQACPG